MYNFWIIDTQWIIAGEYKFYAQMYAVQVRE